MYKSIALFVCSIFIITQNINIQNKIRREIKEKEERIKENNGEKLKLLNNIFLFDSLFLKNESSVNFNIQPSLYKPETFENMDQVTEEENKWKHRILFENTPHGNIVMFYDLYRQAFAYYSDSHLNYSILNHCAMKYVRMFLCRDFFVDTTILPVSFVNPFNKMKEEEEARMKLKSLEKRKDLKLNFDSSSFVKPLKSNTLSNKKKEINTDCIYKNNFRCIGKLSGDWNILQPLPHTKTQYNKIKDDYDHILNQNKPVLLKSTYSLWKNRTEP